MVNWRKVALPSLFTDSLVDWLKKRIFPNNFASEICVCVFLRACVCVCLLAENEKNYFSSFLG